MNGQQHYTEAERLLDGVATSLPKFSGREKATEADYKAAAVIQSNEPMLNLVVAMAQVHATLAQAAMSLGEGPESDPGKARDRFGRRR